MRKHLHVIAMVMCAAILLSMFVSSAYLAHEAVYHHNCSGEDCPVCEFIAQIVELRRSLGMMLLALLPGTAAAAMLMECAPISVQVRTSLATAKLRWKS